MISLKELEGRSYVAPAIEEEPKKRTATPEEAAVILREQIDTILEITKDRRISLHPKNQRLQLGTVSYKSPEVFLTGEVECIDEDEEFVNVFVDRKTFAEVFT